MSLRNWLIHDDPVILQAQYQAYVRQMPPLYLLVIFNIWLLAWTHHHHAPAWLVYHLPALFSAIFLMRCITWVHLRSKPVRLDQVQYIMSRVTLLSVLLTPGLVYWALSLLQYGTASTQSHVAFFMALTSVGVLVCLTQVWQAVVGVTVTVNLVFIVFFFNADSAIFTAMATSMASVTAVMTWMLIQQFKDFTRMHYASRAADAARLDAEKLSTENLRLAHQDSLTGLPNRRHFFTALEQRLAASEQNGQRFAVAILGLDGFKPVNDVYGHNMGDRLLVDASQRLQTEAADHAHIFRLGGDEFALLLHGLDGDSAYTAFAQRICQAMSQPFLIHGATLQVSASVGLAIYPVPDTPQADLHQCANYALFQGKRTNRGNVTLFTREHQARIQRDAVIEQALRTAPLQQELSVHFQPIVNITTGRTVAFEALARWHSPTLGFVSPGEFIPVAERSGLVARLTEELLQQALRHAVTWPEHVSLSFNLSVHDLMAPQEMQRLLGYVQASGMPPSRIDLEITETAATNDTEQMQKVIGYLRDQGFGVALDDLGTGFSSLSQLLALPLTKIKIDRRFVMGIDHKPASRKLVSSLLSFSRDMGLGCVLEGVETPEERATLQDLCGTLIQGYIYSKPMPGDQIPDWLAEH